MKYLNLPRCETWRNIENWWHDDDSHKCFIKKIFFRFVSFWATKPNVNSRWYMNGSHMKQRARNFWFISSRGNKFFFFSFRGWITNKILLDVRYPKQYQRCDISCSASFFRLKYELLRCLSQCLLQKLFEKPFNLSCRWSFCFIHPLLNGSTPETQCKWEKNSDQQKELLIYSSTLFDVLMKTTRTKWGKRKIRKMAKHKRLSPNRKSISGWTIFVLRQLRGSEWVSQPK